MPSGEWCETSKLRDPIAIVPPEETEVITACTRG